jgi:hypothetical protein
VENSQKLRYFKRTQKDYRMSYKLQIVKQIEPGRTSILQIRKAYDIKVMEQSLIGLENLVTLIGTIKHHQIYQNHLNTK